MKLTIATATAAILASAISVSAMSSESIVKQDLRFAGYDADLVDTLTPAQLEEAAFVIHSGEDSEVRINLAKLMKKFAG